MEPKGFCEVRPGPRHLGRVLEVGVGHLGFLGELQVSLAVSLEGIDHDLANFSGLRGPREHAEEKRLVLVQVVLKDRTTPPLLFWRNRLQIPVGPQFVQIGGNQV